MAELACRGARHGLGQGAIALTAIGLLAACERAPPPERFAGRTMGTTYSVEVTRVPPGVTRDELQGVIDEVLESTNRHFSTYDATSEISAFNAATTTDWTPVSRTLGSLVALARDVSLETGGAFDITVGPLVKAWGFGPADDPGAGETAAPDAATLAQLASDTGFDKLELGADGRSLRKAVPGLQLDVDGIAPGYAVDQVAERFEELVVQDYLVEIGGEVRARGQSPAGRPWRVAVEAPVSGERRPYALVELDGLSISTSGDYRDSRVVGGRRVSHTIDPRTGAPVTHALASVCVVHPSSARADAYATALMVLGPVDGLALAERLGLAALFLEREHGQIVERATAGFARLRRPLD